MIFSLPRCDLSQCRVEDEEEMEVEPSLSEMNGLEISQPRRNEPEIDEDGFEMVKTRRKK